jgi:hypothetical protein
LAAGFVLALGALALSGALASFFLYRSLKSALSRIEALESRPANLYESRYAAPVEDIPATSTGVPPMDIVGSWAYEKAQSGERVSDEEIAMQRKMRLAAGL